MAACRFLAKLQELTRSKESSTSIFRDACKNRKYVGLQQVCNCLQTVFLFVKQCNPWCPLVLNGINYCIIYEVVNEYSSPQSTASTLSSKWRFLIDSENVEKFSISLREPFNQKYREKGAIFADDALQLSFVSNKLLFTKNVSLTQLKVWKLLPASCPVIDKN